MSFGASESLAAQVRTTNGTDEKIERLAAAVQELARSLKALENTVEGISRKVNSLR